MRVQREERQSSSTRHEPCEREPERGAHNPGERNTRGMMRTHASLQKVSEAANEAEAKAGSRRALTSHSHVHSRETRMPPGSSGFESEHVHTARGAESDTMITARDMHTSRTDDYLSAVEPNTCRSTGTLVEVRVKIPFSVPDSTFVREYCDSAVGIRQSVRNLRGFVSTECPECPVFKKRGDVVTKKEYRFTSDVVETTRGSISLDAHIYRNQLNA